MEKITSIPPYDRARVSLDDVRQWFVLIESYVHAAGEERLSLASFDERALVSFILESNQLERTIPPDITLDHALEACSASEELSESAENCRWYADGRRNKQGTPALSIQLQRHYQSLLYLLSQEELTPEVVINTHEIMLAGALDHRGERLEVGKFRDGEVFIPNGHVFPPPEAVPRTVEAICRSFEDGLKEKRANFLSLSTKLFFEMIQIHPFFDGNGRLCRMLLAHAIIRLGILPFPLTLSSFHSTSRSDYLRAIKRWQDMAKSSDLHYLVLKSVYRSFRTYPKG